MRKHKRKTTQRGFRKVRVGYLDESGHPYTFWLVRHAVEAWQVACEFPILSAADCGYPIGYGRTA